MLIFSAVCPHSPILIPNIGKENLNNLSATKQALEKLNKKLIRLEPDVIIIISPHGRIEEDSFGVLSSDKYLADFNDFGDIATKLTYKTDADLIHLIYNQIKTELPIKSINNSKLDYGSSIPLYYLLKNLDTSVVSINSSQLDYDAHIRLGELLKNIILDSNKKIAVVSSGDLSHCLSETAPGGYCPQSKGFDQGLIETLKNKKIDQILKLDPDLISDVEECGLRSILVLLGVIQKMNYEPEFLSYESPFGVGHLVMNFKLL